MRRQIQIGVVIAVMMPCMPGVLAWGQTAAERATDELAFALHESPVALKKRIYKRTGRRH